MTILITSDWHLNDNPRDRYRHEWVRKHLPKLIGDHKVYTVVMLGDLTDEQDNHSSQLVNDIVDLLIAMIAPSEAVPWSRELILMRGNHDYVDPHCPFFMFTKEMEGVRWINEPLTLHLDDGVEALFLPHTRDYGNDWQGDLILDSTNPDIIFAHNTFAGTVSESGKELGGIPTSVFPKGTPVISGDIHKPQTVGPVTYVGSPYTIDFGDNFKPRVLLLDGDGPPKSIPCTGPQKVLHNAIDKVQAFQRLQASKGQILKLRVAVAPGDKDKWPTIKRELMDAAVQLGVHLYSVEPLLEQAVSGKRYRTKGKAQRDDEVLKAYCKQQGVERDRENAALEIMKG